MQKFMEWLADEALGFKQITGFVLMAALVDLALVYTVKAALINWGIVEVKYDLNPENPFQYYNALMFVSILVQAPLFEETIFRMVPLTIVVFFTKKPAIVFTTVLIFAALFGAIHPYNAINNAQVAIAGLVFGLVFLKCGGLQGRSLKAWLSAMAAHSMANLFILAYQYYGYLETVL